jgi:hypothetical protein
MSLVDLDFEAPKTRPKAFTEIVAAGIRHAGGLAMLAAQELETLGGWSQLCSVGPNAWAQLGRHVLKHRGTRAPWRNCSFERSDDPHARRTSASVYTSLSSPSRRNAASRPSRPLFLVRPQKRYD